MKNGHLYLRFVIYSDAKRVAFRTEAHEMGSPPRQGEEVTLMSPYNKPCLYDVIRVNWYPNTGDIDADIFLCPKEAA